MDEAFEEFRKKWGLEKDRQKLHLSHYRNPSEGHMRPCWWMGERCLFHRWSTGVPFCYFSHGGLPKECTIGIVERENGEIVNARPESIHFDDDIFREIWSTQNRPAKGEKDMVASITRYVIITKDRPTLFGTFGGEPSDDLSDALFLPSIDEAKAELEKYDEPEMYQICEAVTCVEI